MEGGFGVFFWVQQVANYARTATIVIKPFVDNYDYNTGKTFTDDETYIKGCVSGSSWPSVI